MYMDAAINAIVLRTAVRMLCSVVVRVELARAPVPAERYVCAQL